MIANTLIFLLGMLVTTLVALVLAPFFWRKAQSLARRDFEATVPISANEIRAEFDRVRAEAAVTVRRQEVLTADTRNLAAKAEADRGRLVVETAQLQKQNRRLTQTLEEQDVELEATRGVLAKREEENRRLVEDLTELRHETELTTREFEALGKRFRDLGEVAETQKIELSAAKAKIDRLEARLSPAEGQAGEAESLPPARGTAGEPPRSGSERFGKAVGRRELPALDAAAEADIRERISDVAARVIRMTALAEGADSPLKALLEPGKADTSPSPGGKTTLADRVRLLAEAERKRQG